jgi:hypothetical protein
MSEAEVQMLNATDTPASQAKRNQAAIQAWNNNQTPIFVTSRKAIHSAKNSIKAHPWGASQSAPELNLT